MCNLNLIEVCMNKLKDVLFIVAVVLVVIVVVDYLVPLVEF